MLPFSILELREAGTERRESNALYVHVGLFHNIPYLVPVQVEGWRQKSSEIWRLEVTLQVQALREAWVNWRINSVNCSILNTMSICPLDSQIFFSEIVEHLSQFFDTAQYNFGCGIEQDWGAQNGALLYITPTSLRTLSVMHSSNCGRWRGMFDSTWTRDSA